MKKWTILSLFMFGCFTTNRAQSSKPDDGDLSTFDRFSRWGMGIAGFTAPPSGSAGGGWDTAEWGGDDDTGEFEVWDEHEDHDHDEGGDDGEEEGAQQVAITPEALTLEPSPVAAVGGAK